MNAAATIATMVENNVRFARLIAKRQAVTRGIHRREDIADLEQASMLGLFFAARSWDPLRGAFTTWAGFKCRAEVQVAIRRIRGKGDVAWNAVVDLRDDDPRWGRVEPFVELEAAQREADRAEQVARAIDDLPEPKRTVFLRHWRDGDPFSWMADERGVSRQALSLQMQRVLETVRAEVMA